jgi:ubiquinone/menaquinone biosynthesis C-methylase UbiE
MNKYSRMQEKAYEDLASRWTPEERDHVVGSFDQHNSWADYDEFLFKGVETQDLVALEFACGPGRNIVKFWSRFKQIDGVDIASENLDNARLWIDHNGLNSGQPRLFKSSGEDIAVVTDDAGYDVVFSTIALQHICIHEIRLKLVHEFARVLKPGGWFCAQMGFGPRRVGHSGVGYYENFYDATHTNGGCDCCVTDPMQLQGDLETAGFGNFSYDIRPVGPGDNHDNWIFFRAQKNM